MATLFANFRLHLELDCSICVRVCGGGGDGSLCGRWGEGIGDYVVIIALFDGCCLTHTHARARAHACKHVCTHALTHTSSHMRARTYANTHTYTNARTHTHANTRARTHTHTQEEI